MDDNEIDFGGDEIDFGGSSDVIDFGEDVQIENMTDETGKQRSRQSTLSLLGEKQATPVDGIDDGIARYDQAFSIFERIDSFGQLTDDLEEVGLNFAVPNVNSRFSLSHFSGSAWQTRMPTILLTYISPL